MTPRRSERRGFASGRPKGILGAFRDSIRRRREPRVVSGSWGVGGSRNAREGRIRESARVGRAMGAGESPRSSILPRARRRRGSPPRVDAPASRRSRVAEDFPVVDRRQILVTSALPYVNAGMHLGLHGRARSRPISGCASSACAATKSAIFCGDDTHGTATMLRAEREGRPPEALLEEMKAAHIADLNDFGVVHDHFGSTHSSANHELVGRDLACAPRTGGFVAEREVTQFYDPEAGIFLADRFVLGRCPKCGAADQYGDNCAVCGATYEPTGADRAAQRHHGRAARGAEPRPSLREARTLPRLPGGVDPGEGRDAPGDGELAAGRVPRRSRSGTGTCRARRRISGSRSRTRRATTSTSGSTRRSATSPRPANGATRTATTSIDWWRNPDCEIHHFIGRDIAYFHTLFWPAMLKTAGYQLPTRVHVHGFLGVNGEKMSKRTGTAILARTYLDHLSPEYLRYYYATQALVQVRRPRPQLRRVRAEGERGSRRQGREPREPHRALREGAHAARIPGTRGRRALRRGCRRG